MPNDPALTLTTWHLLAFCIQIFVVSASVAAWVWLLTRRRRGRPILPSDWSLDSNPIPARRPWLASTFLATLGVYIFAQVLVAVLFPEQIELVAKGKGPLSPSTILWVSAFINLLTIILVPIVVWRTAGISLDDLGLVNHRQILRDSLAGLVFLLLAFPIIYGTLYLLLTIWPLQPHPVSDSMKEQSPASIAPLTIISAVFAAPIAEELLFRGAFLGCLTTFALYSERRKRSEHPHLEDSPPPPRVYWTPNILVSFLFAALHTPQWPAPVPLFLLSLGLGWLAQRTGRLAAPIAAHMAFNALSTILMLLVSQGEFSRNAAPLPAPATLPPAIGKMTTPQPATPFP